MFLGNLENKLLPVFFPTYLRGKDILILDHLVL